MASNKAASISQMMGSRLGPPLDYSWKELTSLAGEYPPPPLPRCAALANE